MNTDPTDLSFRVQLCFTKKKIKSCFFNYNVCNWNNEIKNSHISVTNEDIAKSFRSNKTSDTLMWYHWDKLRHYLNDLRVQCANSLHCKNIVLFIVFTVGINFITLTSFTAYTTYRILHTMQVLGGSKSFSCEFIDTKFNIFRRFLS